MQVMIAGCEMELYEPKCPANVQAQEAFNFGDTQTNKIYMHLVKHGNITPLEALNLYGCFRLGARIWDLKHRGVPIIMEWDHRGNKKWARYCLVRKQEEVSVN